jgi:hypothetical protein
MSLLDLLRDNPELLSQASRAMAEFQGTPAGGQWSLTFHYAPGGILETAKVTSRTMEFRIRPLRTKT